MEHSGPESEAARILLLIGSSGHAKVVLDALERAGTWPYVGLLDDLAPRGTEVMGRRVLGKTSELRSIAASTGARWLFVAIGDNWARGELTQRALAQVPALQLATVIHPAAQIARGVEIGEGSVAMAGVVVNYPARIGRGCILNTRSSLDHDGELGEFASLAPGATLGGNVVVGAYSAVGLGANVIHRVAIGEHTVVGAGALVLDDLPPNVVAYGSPARVVRERRADEPYLSRPARNPHP